MKRTRREGESGPLTLGQTLAAKVRLIVWCKGCQHKVEPDIVEQVERYGEAVTVIDWARRLRCSACGARNAAFVVSGARRRGFELCADSMARLYRYPEISGKRAANGV